MGSTAVPEDWLGCVVSAPSRHWRGWGRIGLWPVRLGRYGPARRRRYPLGLLVERDGFKLYECFIDGTFAKAKGGGDGIGKTKAGKGVKIMVLVDARGLPVAIDTCSASPHESTLVQRLFDFMLTTENPERLIGDKAYDSDKLDEELVEAGIEMIAPHRSNRKPEHVTQDGRPMRRYRRRWTVERTIGWIQHFRRLCICWERSSTLFPGVLHLGGTMLLPKEVLG